MEPIQLYVYDRSRFCWLAHLLALNRVWTSETREEAEAAFKREWNGGPVTVIYGPPPPPKREGERAPIEGCARASRASPPRT